MDPLEYLHLQMRLEGKIFSADGLITRLGPESENTPLVLIAKTENGRQVAYFGESLPGNRRRELVESLEKSTFPAMGIMFDQFQSYGIPVKVGHYKTYIVPNTFFIEVPREVKCLCKDDGKVKEFGFGGFDNSVYAIEIGGKIISACVSTRQNGECAESWVYTSPEYRRMGFARKVVGAWAIKNSESNIIPFYSHKIDNLPSAQFANRLGLKPQFEEISIERQS